MAHYHNKIMGEEYCPKEYEKSQKRARSKDKGDVLFDTAKKLISVGIIAGFGARRINIKWEL